MSRTASPSSGKPYGVATVCRIWRVARATVFRHRAAAWPAPPRRPVPAGPIADPGLVEEIRRVLQDSPFHGESHRKVWAQQRVAGIRTSKRRVLRLMRENGLLAPWRAGAPRARDGAIIPDAVDHHSATASASGPNAPRRVGCPSTPRCAPPAYHPCGRCLKARGARAAAP